MIIFSIHQLTQSGVQLFEVDESENFKYIQIISDKFDRDAERCPVNHASRDV